jgi:hypothetical protein
VSARAAAVRRRAWIRAGHGLQHARDVRLGMRDAAWAAVSGRETRACG